MEQIQSNKQYHGVITKQQQRKEQEQIFQKQLEQVELSDNDDDADNQIEQQQEQQEQQEQFINQSQKKELKNYVDALQEDDEDFDDTIGQNINHIQREQRQKDLEKYNQIIDADGIESVLQAFEQKTQKGMKFREYVSQQYKIVQKECPLLRRSQIMDKIFNNVRYSVYSQVEICCLKSTELGVIDYNILRIKTDPMQRHLTLLMWRSIELASNILLFSRLKLPQKTLASGSALRLSLNIIRENVYNYDLGLSTKQCRFLMAALLSPSFFQESRKYQNPLQVLYSCLILFDILGVLDLVQSNQNEVLYSIVFMIRILRILDILVNTIKLIMEITMLIKKMPKQQVKTIEPKKIPLMDCEKTTATSQPTSQQEDSQKGTDLTELKKTATKKSLRGQYPIFNIKIKTQNGSENIILNEVDKFDQAFDQVILDRRTLLNVKLYYCNRVYESIRKCIHKKDNDLLSMYKGLISLYQSEMLLFDY